MTNSTGVEQEGSSGTTGLILGVVLAILIVLIIMVLIKIRRIMNDQNSVTALSANNAPNPQTALNWKINFFDLRFGEQLGQGVTGKVYQATWRGVNVAAKAMIHTAQEDEIAIELSTLIKVRHPNLVLFMGVASPEPQRLVVVSEYMAQGSLFSVLHDDSVPLDWSRRIGFMLDAAKAINYMHGCKPPILHKNLTSRNLLVDAQFVVKVSDYGLDYIREHLKRSTLSTQPLWTAPETYKKSKFTMASDVYSFGIMMWEALTRKSPYQGQVQLTAANTVKVLKDITKGMRPLIPDKTPQALAELIAQCWAQEAARRPNFDHIIDVLNEMHKTKVDMAQIAELAVVVEGGRDAGDAGGADWRSDRKPWMVDAHEVALEEVIGRGSFGQVWAGKFRGKKVAVKKLHLTKSRLSNNTGSFVHELNIMCSLRHPNTVLFMGACLEEGHMSIIMEFCEKGNLYEILHDKAQSMDYNKILKICTEIAEGVLYLHLSTPPILHRDLKSLNILVDEHWNVKVSDFGLTDFKPDVQDKGAGMAVVSPFWLAPEAMENQEFSEASDVYSFGMIVWEMFTRQAPFPNMNPHQAALSVINDDARPDIPAFVPPNFQNLITSCWQRDPQRRPAFSRIIQLVAQLKEEGLPRVELSLATSKLYRKKVTVFAFKSKDTVIVHKPWGTGESKKGDWVVVGPSDDVYTCDAIIFEKTYSSLPERPNLYRKTGKIYALVMERDFLMQTLEGMEHGLKGDILAQNPDDGEQWPISRSTFETMYEVAPSQVLDKNKAVESKGVIMQEELGQILTTHAARPTAGGGKS